MLVPLDIFDYQKRTNVLSNLCEINFFTFLKRVTKGLYQ